MRKQNSIRWSESDQKELRRIVKNYNAKLSRQRKKLIESGKRFEASNLPQRASVVTLENQIKTRKDFNRELSSMQNYIKTGLKFKLDKTTEKSLTATARDFNAKIDRLAKSPAFKGNKSALPEKLDAKKLLRESTSKEALKKNLKDFKGFLKRGAEDLVELPDTKFNTKLTKWQKESMERRLAEINKVREAERKIWEETEVLHGGKPAGYTHGQVGMDKAKHELDDMTMYTWSSEPADLKEKFRLMVREGQEGYWDVRAQLARDNYLEAMERLIGNHPAGKMLINDIKSRPLNEFKRVLRGEADLFAVLYVLKTQPENYLTAIEDIWNEWRKDDMYEFLEDHISKIGE